MKIHKFIVLSAIPFVLSSCEHRNSDEIEPKVQTAAQSAQEVRPLLVGAKVPELSLKTVEDQLSDLNAVIAEKPSVLVFYRGGWCMYCNTQLGQLVQVQQQIKDLGFQIIGISPDKPEKLAESIDKHKMGYTLLSDSTMEAAKAFGIAFKLDDATLAKYAEYGIDLDDATGQSHHLLPVPSIFVLDTNGTLKFQYVNPDYKTRLDPSVLLAAVKAEAKSKR